MHYKVIFDNSWSPHLDLFFKTDFMQILIDNVQNAYHQNVIYPNIDNIFRAFDLCDFQNLKVVILGQDPYHNQGQANGLSFSVNSGVAIPPSLQNIYREIQSDLLITPNHNDGDLSRWAKQGVLLLNSTLTVEAGVPNSHKNLGWNVFTDFILSMLSKCKQRIVYLLWGNFAREKKKLIDCNSNLILEANHPSPLSAYRGFFGCKHFSQANSYLTANSHNQLIWT